MTHSDAMAYIASALSEAQVRASDAYRVTQTLIADASPGYPCRNTLEDAAVGEEIQLVHFQHQPVGTHAASGPVYLSPGAPSRPCEPGEIPPMVRTRLISLRGYDAAHSLVTASVTEGNECGTALDRLFDQPDVSYVHAHFAKHGCYACRFDRIP